MSSSNEISKLKMYFKAAPQKYSADNLETLQQDTDEKTVLKILGHFSDSLLTSSIELERAIEEHNIESVWKIAHKLTSSAQLLGFTHFYDLSKALTRAIKSTEHFEAGSEQVHTYYKEINSIYSNLRDLYPNLKQLI